MSEGKIKITNHSIADTIAPTCPQCHEKVYEISGYSSIYSDDDITKFGLRVPKGDTYVLLIDWYCEHCDEHTETLNWYLPKTEGTAP